MGLINWMPLVASALGGLVGGLLSPFVAEYSREKFFHRKQGRDAKNALVAAATKLEFEFLSLEEAFNSGGSTSATTNETRALAEFGHVLASVRVFLSLEVVRLAALVFAQYDCDLHDIDEGCRPRSLWYDHSEPDALTALYEELKLPATKRLRTIQNEARAELAKRKAVATTSP